MRKNDLIISETEEFYHFQTKSNELLLSEIEYDKKYRSKQFNLLFPEKKYNGAKYLILIEEEEINIYNLYTNNLIACYVSAFSSPQLSVPHKDGWFTFAVGKSAFNENLFNMKIQTELP